MNTVIVYAAQGEVGSVFVVAVDLLTNAKHQERIHINIKLCTCLNQNCDGLLMNCAALVSVCDR